ncbi:MAG: HAMP domain-containing histidine kinase [Planctomycetes bacterium]|nr:HAMP domain-containing histidine kinase [Planctomycetota bacterium]
MSEIARFKGIARPVVESPARKAAVSALLYVFFCVAYIVVSGWIAAAAAASTEELRGIETVKGTLFVVVTGALFYAVMFVHWRRIRAGEDTIIAQEEALLQSERKAVAAMCAASMAHDLNNLLMSLAGLVEGLRGLEKGDDLLRDMRARVESGIESLARMSRRIATTARQVLPAQRVRLDLVAVIAQATALVRKHPDVSLCPISLPEGPEVPASVSRDLFEEALMNLVINAAQAGGRGSRIEVRCRQEGGHAVVEVHDQGPGVLEEAASLIFDPCFTTKPSGSGLGLVAVKTFAASHDGAVSVGKSPLGGAAFSLRFPLVSSAGNGETAACGAPHAAR